MKTVLNIKADRDTKEKAQKLAAELGLPLGTIINAYLKDFVRNRSVNFSAIPRMSKGLELLLGKIEKDVEARKNFSPAFKIAGEVSAYLDTL